MPLTKQRGANQYVDSVNFTSTGGDVGWGFEAGMLRLVNRSTKSVYLTLNSTTGATTSGHELGSSESITVTNILLAGFSFAATSSGGNLTVGAWGF